MQSKNKFNEKWERTKRHLIRNMLVETPGLSTIQEENSSASSPRSLRSYRTPSPRLNSSPRSPRSDCGPLPPLIMEREPNKHDEPEEYYTRLEKKVRKIYRKLILNENVRISSSSDDMDDIDDTYHSPIEELNDERDSLNEQKSTVKSDDDGSSDKLPIDLYIEKCMDQIRKIVDQPSSNQQYDAELMENRHSPEEKTIDDAPNEQELTADNLENVDMSLTLIDNGIVHENPIDAVSESSTDIEAKSTTSIENHDSKTITSVEDQMEQSDEIETESTEIESQLIITTAEVHRAYDDISPVISQVAVEDDDHIAEGITSDKDGGDNQNILEPPKDTMENNDIPEPITSPVSKSDEQEHPKDILEIHRVSVNTPHVEEIEVMRTPRHHSHGSPRPANPTQTFEDPQNSVPQLSAHEDVNISELDNSNIFDILRLSSPKNHSENTSGRKRKSTTSFAGVGKRQRFIDVGTQTAAQNAGQSAS